MSTGKMSEDGLNSEQSGSEEDKVCYNPNCEKKLVQREGEANFKFAKRKHCGEDCSKSNPLVYQVFRDMGEARRASTSRQCPICGETFNRRKGETVKTFQARETCSRKCSDENRKRRKQEEVKNNPKKCLVCGEDFYRRPDTETLVKFSQRKTCGPECGHVEQSSTWKLKSYNGRLAAARSAQQRKDVQEHKLKPVKPITREIPDAPSPTTPRPVWRPNAPGW